MESQNGNGFRVIYPTENLVSEQQIRTWLADALANGDVRVPEEVNPQTIGILAAVELLEDSGKFTFA